MLERAKQLTESQYPSAPLVEQCEERRTRDQRCLLVRFRQVFEGSDVAIRGTIRGVVPIRGARLAIEIVRGANPVVTRVDRGGARREFLSGHRVEQRVGEDFARAR